MSALRYTITCDALYHSIQNSKFHDADDNDDDDDDDDDYDDDDYDDDV